MVLTMQICHRNSMGSGMCRVPSGRHGYTIVELIVTMVIVVVVSATVGGFFVKLLTFHEKERHRAYIQERLVDICGFYADYLSLGTNVCNDVNRFGVDYRVETGGVSFETGRVSRVAQFVSSMKTSAQFRNTTLDFSAWAFEPGIITNKFCRNLRGDDTPLVPLSSIRELKIKGRNVNLSHRLDPLNASGTLWHLQVLATYEVEDGDSEAVRACRIVRLWNRE